MPRRARACAPAATVAAAECGRVASQSVGGVGLDDMSPIGYLSTGPDVTYRLPALRPHQPVPERFHAVSITGGDRRPPVSPTPDRYRHRHRRLPARATRGAAVLRSRG